MLLRDCTLALRLLLLGATTALAEPTAPVAEQSTDRGASHEADPDESQPPWCAPEVERLSDEICHFSPRPAGDAAPRTLVIYLHGVIQASSTWQHTQQRALVRHAKVHGFSVLLPRGRRGIGPKGMRDWWTWPTSVRAQQQVEDELIHEWMQARALLEQRNGRAFDAVYVFGFSNGAYYASALALRGKLDVDGYAVFAGGSAGYLERHARQTGERPPIYVGYGDQDRTARHDCQRLGAALRSLGWPYRMKGRPRVGHTITDTMVSEALAFFGRSE